MEKYIKVPKDTSDYSITDNYGIKLRFSIDLSIDEYDIFRKEGLDTKVGDIKSLTIEFNNLSIQVIDPIGLRITRRRPRYGVLDITISIDYDDPSYNLTVGKALMRDRILEGLLN